MSKKVKSFIVNEKGMGLVSYIGLMAVSAYLASLMWESVELLAAQQVTDVTKVFTALFS